MKKRNIIFNLITVICFITIAVCLYNIIRWFIDNNKTSSIMNSIYEKADITYKKDDTNSDEIEKLYCDFTELLAENENTVGWINVKNTNIDYPVVQHTDNSYYLSHSFDKTSSNAGWVFADYRNKLDGSDRNIIIYRT